MKVKFKQSIYVISENRIVDANEELDLNKEVAESLVEANYAEVVKEKEVKAPAEPKAKAKAKNEKAGE